VVKINVNNISVILRITAIMATINLILKQTRNIKFVFTNSVNQLSNNAQNSK